MRGQPWRAPGKLAVAALPLLVAAEPSSPFAPASYEARAVANLFLGLLVLGTLLFLFVVSVILFAVLRRRARPGEPDPPPKVGGHGLEVTWTVAPVFVLLFVFAWTIPTLINLPTPKQYRLSTMAIGHRYWWEFRYPAANVVTANELHIPTDVDVEVQLQSVDVIHSFWVPRLNGKQDLIPGRTNRVSLYAEEPGTYLGQCAEFCGLQHAGMLLRVVAQPREEFDAWLAAQQQPHPAPADEPASRGQQVFFSQTCIDCHTIAGTDAQGTNGPDLTHVGSRQTLAAGELENTPANLARWLDNPQAIKPGALMPAFKLSQDDVQALVAFLEGGQ
ncbi:MAG TPA: cytochrome c oxidase subunit II [Chloroflexota bacterium]|jgi:cytochrome c oxidase subunit 2